jgi:hypothetical protein
MGTQVAAKQLLSFQNKAKDEVTRRKANARVAKHDFSRDDDDSDSDTDRCAGLICLAVCVLLDMGWVCLVARAGGKRSASARRRRPLNRCAQSITSNSRKCAFVSQCGAAHSTT